MPTVSTASPTPITQMLPYDAAEHDGSEGAPSTSEGESHNVARPSTPTTENGGQPDSSDPIPEEPRVSNRMHRSPVSPSTVPTPTPPPGWNAQHTHNTRFRARLQANFTCAQAQSNRIQSTGGLHVPDTIHALFLSMEQMHKLDDGTFNFCHSSAYTAPIEKDTLHYGDMLTSEDRPQFVEAMKLEVAGIQNMLEVAPRSSIPLDNKPLPAVWAF